MDNLQQGMLPVSCVCILFSFIDEFSMKCCVLLSLIFTYDLGLYTF
jgi:hypothetical protein